jgi:LmbE family N-acetylglucosaminyl deacetylase
MSEFQRELILRQLASRRSELQDAEEKLQIHLRMLDNGQTRQRKQVREQEIGNLRVLIEGIQKHISKLEQELRDLS